MSIECERIILSGILPNKTARMEKAQLRLIAEHNFKTPAFKSLWEYLDSYYDDHNSILPEWALKERAIQAGEEETRVLSWVELYKNLSGLEIRESEFDEAIRLVKEEEVTYKTELALVNAREILHGDYYDESTDTSVRGQEKAREYLSQALQDLETINADYAPEGDIKDDTEKLWREYEFRETNPLEAGGIKYGISEVDENTGGIRPGELVLVAGFSGSGKSHIVTNLAWQAIIAKKNVLMFTTETTREEMEIRLFARHSRLPEFKTPAGIDSHDILHGTLPTAHKQVFRQVLTDFKQRDTGKLFMVQMPSSGLVDYVQAKANQYNRKAPIDLILIDSINLLRMSGKPESKRIMLEDMLQLFKRFASSFDGGRGVAIVSPWQMSRERWREAQDQGGVYSLASLADTSEAEKSAAQIISIFKEGSLGTDPRLNIQVLKNRSGKEMNKVSYPFDFRNSFIGSGVDSSDERITQGNSSISDFFTGEM